MKLSESDPSRPAWSGRRRKLRRFVALGLGSALVLTAATFSANPAQAKDPSPGAGNRPGLSDKASFYDSRKDPAAAKSLGDRAAQLAARPKSGVASLRKELGVQGVVSMDPLTGTARSVSRLDGFLTAPSARPARTIALDYVRSHRDVFGLDESATARLALRRDYLDVAGVDHLSFVQSVGGIPVVGNGVQANVAKDGRLVNVIGSPVASLPTAAAAPGISAGKARNAAISSVEATPKPAKATGHGRPRQTTVFAGGDRAQLAYFMTAGGLRLAWQTLTSPSTKEMYSSIVDAASGKVLYRQSLVANDNGLAWDNYPGATNGGAQKSRNLTAPGWLPNDSPRLARNTAHVYHDAHCGNAPPPAQEITPSGKRQFNYAFTPFNS